MNNDKIVQLKSYDEKNGTEIGNVLPITNSEAVKVENNQNLKEKLTEITNKIDQTNASLDNIELQGQMIKSNGQDDTEQLQSALNNKGKIILNDNYIISSNLIIRSDTIIEGNGKIYKKEGVTINDMLLINEANASNIKIKGISIYDANRFGIQVFGNDVNNDSKPHNIIIESVHTENCNEGGIFLASCYNIKVSNCSNIGGRRHIGTFAPIDNPNCTHDIIIVNNKTEQTNAFGYQTYYGKDIIISNNIADGTYTTTGDKSCITVDRSTNVSVIGNLCTNAQKNNIFVTGTTMCSIIGNTTINAVEYNIQVLYNIETSEDKTIKECNYTTINSNILTGTGLIINSAKNTVISNNVINSSNDSIYIMQQIRSGDSVQMETLKLTVTNNICNNSIQRKSTVDSITFIDNICSSYTGLTLTDIVYDRQMLRFGRKQLEEIGNIKRTNMSDDFRILEYQLSTTSVQKGMIQAYQYGVWRINDSDNVNRFSFFNGVSGNQGDFEINTASKGLILKSPNGTRKRICLNDSGEIIAQSI